MHDEIHGSSARLGIESVPDLTELRSRTIRRTAIALMIGAAIGGLVLLAQTGLRTVGLNHSADAIKLIVTTLVVLVVAPNVISWALNLFVGAFRRKRIRLGVWFFVRDPHRWETLPRPAAEVEWDALYDIPRDGRVQRADACTHCTDKSIEVLAPDGRLWKLQVSIPARPHVEWMAGLMIAREKRDDESRWRWRFRPRIVFGCQQPLNAEEEAAMRQCVGNYPPGLPATFAQRTSPFRFTRMYGRTRSGDIFGAYALSGVDEDQSIIIGPYAAYMREPAMPASGAAPARGAQTGE